MNGLTINLLPTDLLIASKEVKKRSKVIQASIAVVGLIVVITVGILVMRLIQNSSLNAVNHSYSDARTQVATFKDQEGELVFLKKRLGSIDQLFSQDSKTYQAYNLVNSVFPASVNVLSLSLDKGGTIVVSVQAPDDFSLQQMFNNITDTSVNQGKVSKVQIDSMNRNGNGIYRVDMTIGTI